MSPYEVVRTFGLWGDGPSAPHLRYRLVRLLGDTGLSPYALQYGEIDTHTGQFHVIDAHRQDASLPLRLSPEQWGYEWVDRVYRAERMLTYEATMRIYEALRRLDLAVREDGVTPQTIPMVLGCQRELRTQAGFDPLPDFPRLERLLNERDRDTTTPDTTTRIHVRSIT